MTSDTAFGKTIKFFLVDGTPDGLRKITLNGWTGMVLVSGHTTFDALVARDEVKRTGIYILSGPDPDMPGQTRVYIGSANSVAERIRQSTGTRQFWKTAITVTTSDDEHSKGHAEYLEARVIEQAAQAAQVVLDNGTQPDIDRRRLPEADRGDMEQFLSNLGIILPLIGLDLSKSRESENPLESRTSVLAPDHAPDHTSEESIKRATRKTGKKAGKNHSGFNAKETRFEIRHKSGVRATLVEKNGEFIVEKGSCALTGMGYTSYDKISGRKDKLINEGILVRDETGWLRFSKPCIFDSLSTASSVILDRTSNGFMEWKEMKSGLSYKDWRQKNTEGNGNTQQGHVSHDLDEVQFEIRHKSGIQATLVERNGEFVILEGSEAMLERNRVKHKYSGLAERKKMLDDSVLVLQGNDRLRLVKSCSFKSLSVTAGIVFGRSSSGPMEWKEKKSGLSYSDWQKKLVKGRKAEKPVSKEPDIPTGNRFADDDVKFEICHKSGVRATMIQKDGKFIVEKGSQALTRMGYASSGKISGRKDKLINEGILVQDDNDVLRFDKPCIFDSLSMASSVILDRTSNGSVEWKEIKSGLSYRIWRQKKAENNNNMQQGHNSRDLDEVQFEIRHKSGIQATLVERNGEFVILEGSCVVKDQSGIPKHYSGLAEKKRMIHDGILEQDGNDRLRLVKSWHFKSLSTAASIVLDRSSNGHKQWKEKKLGLCYSDWQQKMVQEQETEKPVSEEPDIPAGNRFTDGDVQFEIRHKSGVQARMIEKDGKFVVSEGSEALVNPGYARKEGHTGSKRREKMISEGTLVQQGQDRLRFARPCQFDSPSTASAVILDRSSNGHKEWREVNSGLSYQDWQQKMVQEQETEKPVSEEPDIPAGNRFTDDDVQFEIRHKSGVQATMIEKDGKFVVSEGSEALVNPGYARKEGHPGSKRREKMISEGTLVQQGQDRLRFARPCQFDSPSTASAVILDRSSNGHKEWREVNSGLCYSDWQQKMVQEQETEKPVSEEPDIPAGNRFTDGDVQFEIRHKSGVQARMIEKDGKFVVSEGSEALVNPGYARKEGHTGSKRREKMISEGTLVQQGQDRLRFARPCQFDSPSTASAVILDRSSNGHKEWREVNSGLSYQDWQQKMVQEQETEKPVSEEPDIPAGNRFTDDDVQFEIRHKSGVRATMFEKDGKFVVSEGSEALVNPGYARKEGHTGSKRREKMISEGTLVQQGQDRLRFARPCQFDSPSTASAVILDRSSNGHKEWREVNSGLCYSDWQQKMVQEQETEKPVSEEPDIPAGNRFTDGDVQFEIRHKSGVQARMIEKDGKFVVSEGSEALVNPGYARKEGHTGSKRREKMISEGTLVQQGQDRLRFARPCQFDSPSTASAVILNRSSNGHKEWREVNSGLSYQDWQQK